MMDLAMNFDTDECLVTAMFDKGNRNDTMEAIDNIIPFLKGDADMIGLVCNTIRKLFCMSDEGYGEEEEIVCDKSGLATHVAGPFFSLKKRKGCL